MRKKLSIFFFCCFSVFSFSQTEEDCNEIYSKIIISNLNNFQIKIDTVIIIETMIDKQNIDFSFINEIITNDKKQNLINDLYLYTDRDSTFIKKYLKEKDIENVIKNLISNFENHPKIQIEKLTIPRLYKHGITYQKYTSFFGRKFKKIDLGWKNIKKKYKTNVVFELSRIEFNENFASVYFANHCGGLCGSGSLIIMEKIKNEWEILTKINLWRS